MTTIKNGASRNMSIINRLEKWWIERRNSDWCFKHMAAKTYGYGKGSCRRCTEDRREAEEMKGRGKLGKAIRRWEELHGGEELVYGKDNRVEHEDL
jgi:hypothetical protein